MSVEGTAPGPRAASDDEAGEDEAGRGEAEVEGQSQRRGAPCGLSAESAEAGAGDMDVAEAPEATTDGVSPRPKPSDWATRTPNQKKNWNRAQRKQ